MERLTPEQRSQIVEIYYQNQYSVRQTYRALYNNGYPHFLLFGRLVLQT